MTVFRCVTALRLAAGPTIFFRKLARCGCIQRLFDQQLLRPRVLDLKSLQTVRLGDLHAAVFGFPSIKRRFSNSVLGAEIGHFPTCLLFLQHRNNLLFRKSLLLYSSVLNGPVTDPFSRKFSAAGQPR